MCGDNVPLNCYFSEENCTLKPENVTPGRLCSWYSYNSDAASKKEWLLSTEQEQEGKKETGRRMIKNLLGLEAVWSSRFSFRYSHTLVQVKLLQVSSACLSSDFSKSNSRSENIPQLNPNFSAHLSVSYQAQKLWKCCQLQSLLWEWVSPIPRNYQSNVPDSKRPGKASNNGIPLWNDPELF